MDKKPESLYGITTHVNWKEAAEAQKPITADDLIKCMNEAMKPRPRRFIRSMTPEEKKANPGCNIWIEEY